MKTMNFEKIDLEKLSDQLQRYVGRWIAIAEDNTIIGAGATYDEAVAGAEPKKKPFVLLKVPALDATLAPTVS